MGFQETTTEQGTIAVHHAHGRHHIPWQRPPEAMHPHGSQRLRSAAYANPCNYTGRGACFYTGCQGV